MLEKRLPKDDDQERAQEACVRLVQTIEEIQMDNIEPNLIMGALWTIVAIRYMDSGFSFKQFKDELQNVAQNYKRMFEA